VNRNRIIAGGALGLLLVLIVAGLSLLIRELQSQQPQVNQREPITGLAYCHSNQMTPCIISFSRDQNGDMLVNILTRGTSFPDFYLKIKHSEGESIYQCHKVKRFSTSVFCIGKVLPLGEMLQFFIFSTDDNNLLAQGNFSIIGMAFSTLEVFASTVEGTPPTQITGFPTQDLSTSISTQVTPTRTPTSTRTPSYPNPSTRTPSYPNPSP
jgi:hypothetical protein